MKTDQIEIFHNQLHGTVSLVEEINGWDFVVFWGANMVSIFFVNDDGNLNFYDEFTANGITNSQQAGNLARIHIIGVLYAETDN